jgi:oxygen-independent coproporphyrinogen-3 oxidase
MEDRKGVAVYVQVPFCPDRCDYCAIPVSVSTALLPRYLEALSMEVRRILPLPPGQSPLSLYIGGGSPTGLPLESFRRLLEILRPFFSENGGREVTLESRPEDLDREKLAILREIPGLRLSLGMEGTIPEELPALGRRGAFFDPPSLLDRLRKDLPGVSLSMDFIAGGEDGRAERFLKMARALGEGGLDHLSLYPLVIEEHTTKALHKKQGRSPEGLEEAAAEEWVAACRGLSSLGWERYEVSNFSRHESRRCRHNLHVWQGGDYLGLGAGAHQRRGLSRRENVRSLSDYVRISEAGENPYELIEEISRESYDIETLYGNLRTSSGISVPWLLERMESISYGYALSELVRIGVVDSVRTNEERLVFNDEGLSALDPLVLRLLSFF